MSKALRRWAHDALRFLRTRIFDTNAALSEYAKAAGRAIGRNPVRIGASEMFTRDFGAFM